MTYSLLQSLIDIALVWVLVWICAAVDSVRTIKRFSGVGYLAAFAAWWKR